MDPRRLREISILVDSLDMDRADKLLEKLPPAVQQQVRDAVVMLDDVGEQERKEVIDRFLGRTRPNSPPPSETESNQQVPSQNPTSGVYGDPRFSNQNPPSKRSALPPELAEKLGIQQKAPSESENAARKALEAAGHKPSNLVSDSLQKFSSEPNQSTAIPADQSNSAGPVASSSFDLIDELEAADPDTLAEVVVNESPQFIAVVLSMLPAEKSVRLLEMFSSSKQEEILRRLESLQSIDEEILDEISNQLRSVLRRRAKLKTRQATGRVAIAKILSAAQRVKSGAVVRRIENQLEPSFENRSSSSVAVSATAGAGGSYQFSAEGAPAGAVSTGLPGEISSPFSGGASKGDGNVQRRSLEQDLQSRIDQARKHLNIAEEDSNQTSVGQELSPAESLLAKERSVSSQIGTPENSSPSRLPRTSSDLEQSLLTDEVDSVEGFADQEIKISFEKLQKCDKASLQALLATAKPKLTLLALRGAPAGLTKKVLKMLPKAEAKEVEFRIQNMGPTRLIDIQKAQNYLLRLASLLEKLGRFRFPRGFFG